MERMATLTLGTATFSVAFRPLLSKCRRFAATSPSSPYHVKSSVNPATLRFFLSAVEGNTVSITNENFAGLSQLSDEFGFRGLADDLAVFEQSLSVDADVRRRISVLEELVIQQERRIAFLEGRMSSDSIHSRAVLTRVESELSTLKADFIHCFPHTSTKPSQKSPVAQPPKSKSAPRLDSLIVSAFPLLFQDFAAKRFTLLWRGSRDGFRAKDFHERCDGHSNTLTLVTDTNGNIFGGFTPVEWDSKDNDKADPSGKSFLFTLKNQHNVGPKKFPLKATARVAILTLSYRGPAFGGGADLMVWDQCNANNRSHTLHFGGDYTNDTGLAGDTFFTGSPRFQVREVEVFEIID
jgi:hypothetical protein